MTTSIPVPVTNLGLLYVNNLQVSVASNTTLTMQAGQARDVTNTQDIVLTSPLTINAAVNGVNGLDVGTFAASNLYYVFVMASSSGYPTAAIMSLSWNAPTLPFGYNLIRRVAVAISTGSIHFLTLIQTGNSEERKYQFVNNLATSITAGHAVVATPISLLNLVPNTTQTVPVEVYYSYTPNTAGNALSLSPTTNLTGVPTITGQVASVANTGLLEIFTTIVNGNPTIYYAGTSASDTTVINVQGFTDFL